MTTDTAPRPEKVAIVEEITAKLNNSVSVFVTEYRGMSVGALANLRAPLREAGAEHKERDPRDVHRARGRVSAGSPPIPKPLGSP